MTVKEANSLKTCPFCGHVAILNTSTDGKYYWVSCSNDECDKCKSTKEEAINAWNKRYDEKSQSEIYDLKGVRNMADEEMKLREEAREIYEKATDTEMPKNKSTNDAWIPLFLSLLTMCNSSTPNIQLEKEVAYLSGKVDTLEKIIISKENR